MDNEVRNPFFLNRISLNLIFKIGLTPTGLNRPITPRFHLNAIKLRIFLTATTTDYLYESIAYVGAILYGCPTRYGSEVEPGEKAQK